MGEIRIHHVNVGFGDATIIETFSDDNTVKRVLIDAGPYSEWNNLGSYILNNIAEAIKFDYIIASHYHLDHIGGFLSGMFSFDQYIDIGIIDNYIPGYLFNSLYPYEFTYTTRVLNLINQDNDTEKVVDTYKKITESHVRYPISFEKDITLGKVGGEDIKLRLIAGNCCLPGMGYIPSGVPKNLNDTSLCFILECGSFAYYTGGDLSGDIDERNYWNIETPLAKLINRQMTVMKANHHGSRFSNNETFISKLQPKHAIFFPYMENGLPNLECLNRFYEQTGKGNCQFYFTSKAYSDFMNDIKKLAEELEKQVKLHRNELSNYVTYFDEMVELCKAINPDRLFTLAKKTAYFCQQFGNAPLNQLPEYNDLFMVLWHLYNFCKYNLYIKTDQENLLAWVVRVTPGQVTTPGQLEVIPVFGTPNVGTTVSMISNVLTAGVGKMHVSILDDLFVTLKSRVVNNHLLLNNDIVVSGDFAVLLRLLDAGQLDIALKADPVQSGNSIQIMGEAVVFGLKLSDLELNFASDETDNLQCGLKAVVPSLAFPDFVAFLVRQGLIPPGKLNDVSQFLNYTFSNVTVDYQPGGKTLSLELTESTQQWSIHEHAGVILERIGFRFARQDGEDDILLALTGKMKFDGNTIDVAVYLPVGPFILPDTYILNISSPLRLTSVLGSIVQFLNLSGIDLAGYFPEELDTLDLQIDSLEIQFYPRNQTGERIGYMMFEISSGKSFGISDSLVIENPAITLYIDFNNVKRVFAKISGELNLGKNNKVMVFIIIPETGDWSLVLDGQTQVGRMSTLGNVLDDGVLNLLGLPAVFSNAKELELPYFRLDFDPLAKTVSFIGLYLCVDDLWNLPGGISVGCPRLHLDINWPFDKNNRSIEARIDGVMAVEGVSFDVRAARNNQGWLFSGDLVDNWVLPVGIADLVITRASVSYDSDKNTGKIAATAAIGSSSLSLDLDIPGGITVGGTLAEIDIKNLAGELCGGFIDLPPGFPEIMFQNSAVTLAATDDASRKRYDFSLQTMMDIDRIGATITVVFEIHKEGKDTGFVFGLLAPGKWSPAQLWPSLSVVMQYLVFQQWGLILSSFGQTSYIPAVVTIPGVPGVIQKGVTVFTTIGLKGPLFSLIGKLFPDPGGLNLSANINPGNLPATSFIATLGQPAGQGSLSFDTLQIVIVPEQEHFYFSAGLTFDVSKVSDAPTQLCLAVEAGILLPSPGSSNSSITFSILMKSVKRGGQQQETTGWQDPFGIRGFVIEGFGLEFVLSETTVVNFLGLIEIGKGDDRFQLAMGGGLADFEVPTYIEFDLKEKASGKPVTIADIVKGFTSLDVSRVPVLDKAGFKRFNFRLVLKPVQNPLNPVETWPPGIFLDGDVEVYGLAIGLKIITNYNKGLAAAGFINEKIDPLGLGVLVIAETKGSARGPRASIDTTALTGGGDKKLFTMHGDVSLLGLVSEQIEAEEGLDGVQFTLDYSFLGSTGKIVCLLKSPDDFYAFYDVSFNLDVTVGPLTVNGVTIFPSIHIHPAVKAGLHFTVTINSTDKFKFTVKLSFEFLGVQFNPEFSLPVADLGHLWDLIKQWLENNAGEIFKDLLNDVDQFLRVFAGELKGLGKDIAHILHDGFRLSTREAIEALRIVGYGLEEAQGLLEDVYHDVADVLESVYGYFPRLPKKACSATTAVSLMARAVGPCATDVSDTLTWLHKLQADLQQTSQGRFYLSVYYAGNESINYLLSNDDGVREAVAGLQGIKLMNQLVQAIKDNNISIIEPSVYENALAVIGIKLTAAAKNPAYRAHIDPQAVIDAVLAARRFVPQYVGLTYDQIMEKLKEQSQ